jgi:hypothetical protein
MRTIISIDQFPTPSFEQEIVPTPPEPAVSEAIQVEEPNAEQDQPFGA